jgi:hypothetical protein
MTPKEKAKELIYKFDNTMEFSTPKRFAKQCALMAVDEILNNFGLRTNGQKFYTEYSAVEYYQEVKKEIEIL